jgi:hypothetical protein
MHTSLLIMRMIQPSWFVVFGGVRLASNAVHDFPIPTASATIPPRYSYFEVLELLWMRICPLPVIVWQMLGEGLKILL